MRFLTLFLLLPQNQEKEGSFVVPAKTYKIAIHRSGPAVFIQPPNDNITCFLSKSLAFPPVKIGDKIYNQEFFENLTRFDRVDPFTGQKLEENWHTPSSEALKILSDNVKFSDILTEVEGKFSTVDLASTNALAEEISKADWCEKIKNETFKIPENLLKKIVTETKIQEFIEKQARSAHPGDKLEDLLKNLENLFDQASEILNQSHKYINESISTLNSENLEKQFVEMIDRIISCTCKDKNFNQLGQILELQNRLKFYGADFLDSKKGKKSSRQDEGMKIKMSGWEEDIKCVCELHGFPKTCSLQQQLQALDKELQSLKESHADQSKMDRVRAMYVYKQRQAVAIADRTGVATDTEKLAYSAYLLSLTENKTGFEKFENLFFTGRALYKLGQISDSEYLLKNALAKSPKNLDARLYLALCYKKSNRSDAVIQNWLKSSLQIYEKYLIKPIYKTLKNSEFQGNYGLFTYKG